MVFITRKMIIMVTGHWPHNICVISRGLGFFSSTQKFYYYITTFTKTCHSVEYTVNSIHWLITIQRKKLKGNRALSRHKYNLGRIICVSDAEIWYNNNKRSFDSQIFSKELNIMQKTHIRWIAKLQYIIVSYRNDTWPVWNYTLDFF